MIRAATKADAKEILRLINELALYEKEPDAVKTTEANLIEDGLASGKYFECLVSESETGDLNGFALYFFTWSTWEGKPSLYLEDLFVEPKARGTGLGLAFLRRLAALAVKKDCKRFEWSVLDWNELARDFYHKIGAKHKQGWLPYRLEGEALLELAKQG